MMGPLLNHSGSDVTSGDDESGEGSRYVERLLACTEFLIPVETSSCSRPTRPSQRQNFNSSPKQALQRSALDPMSSSDEFIARVPDVNEEEEYWLRLLSDLGSEPSVPLSMRPSPQHYYPAEHYQVDAAQSAASNTYSNSPGVKTTPDLRSVMPTGHVSAGGSDQSEYANMPRVLTPTHPPPPRPASVMASDESNGKKYSADQEGSDTREDSGENERQLTLPPDMWGESDSYISDQIEFIFCSDNKEDYEDPHAYGGDRLDALALCRSSIIQLQPVLSGAVDYAAEKVKGAGQLIYDRAAARLLTSRGVVNALEDSKASGAASAPRHFVPARLTASLGGLHETILFLAQHLDSAALGKYVRTASGTVVTLRDIAVLHIARYVRSNVYLSSFVGCVHESTLFMVDRLRAGVELYSHILQGDDPEKMHLELLKDKPDWQHLLLRCSMASLTWKQRQLLEETRDGGSISGADFRRLAQAQLQELDRQRVARVASEYFYLSPEAVRDAVVTSSTPAVPTPGVSQPRALPAANQKAPASTQGGMESARASSESPVEDDSAEGDGAVKLLKSNIHSSLVEEASLGDEDAQYALAKFFTPPGFAEAPECVICNRGFSITLFRHHCRFCGRSVCDDHSQARRCIYRYGMVTPVRVCQQCAESIDETHRMDAILWKDLRISAYLRNKLIPYFNPAVDRGIDKVFRVADYSIAVARNALTYNLPAKLAIETVDVLKRYGLTGFTGLMLRKDFLESVELLKRISGMESMFSLSLHELTACVYYKLAIERGLRGSNPQAERLAHAPRAKSHNRTRQTGSQPSQADAAAEDYECKDAEDSDVQLAIKFAPLALSTIYEENPVDCQRLAKLQGWDTIFTNMESELAPEQPCYALLGAAEPVDGSGVQAMRSTASGEKSANDHGRKHPRREAVLVIRGTQTIQDVVTDIRAAPQFFPPPADEVDAALRGSSSATAAAPSAFRDAAHTSPGKENGSQWDWLAVPSHHTYACGGMVRSAMYILREVGPAVRRLHSEGYKLTVVGHSLGGAVAALVTFMLQSAIPTVSCVTYGCPSCVDAATSDLLRKRVLSVVLHDDVISRITPQTIRLLMRELMVFREQMFQHLQQEWVDVLRRAAGLWTPRWRQVTAAVPSPAAVRTTPSIPTAKAELVEVTIDPSGGVVVAQQAGGIPAHAAPAEGVVSEPSSVMVEEEELAQLWLPGRVMHIYICNGQCFASEVSRNFPDLRVIALQGNIFEDHRSERMLNVLLEVRAVRQAPHPAPAWQSYDESDACACCHNSFTWNSTFTGQAQEFRDKYNCRNCGHLVCDACSSQRRAIPRFGHIIPKRICDQCVLNGDFASM